MTTSHNEAPHYSHILVRDLDPVAALARYVVVWDGRIDRETAQAQQRPAPAIRGATSDAVQAVPVTPTQRRLLGALSEAVWQSRRQVSRGLLLSGSNIWAHLDLLVYLGLVEVTTRDLPSHAGVKHYRRRAVA